MWFQGPYRCVYTQDALQHAPNVAQGNGAIIWVGSDVDRELNLVDLGTAAYPPYQGLPLNERAALSRETLDIFVFQGVSQKGVYLSPFPCFEHFMRK
jgi:hypothetical protein